MKYFALLCVLFLIVDRSIGIPKYENCDRQVLAGEDVKNCLKVTCVSKEDVRITTCNNVKCKDGKQTGYHNGNPHEEYPACCSYPICKK